MKKTLIIIAVVVALGGVSFIVYRYWFSTPANKSGVELEDSESVNYDPPSQSEIEEARRFKENQISENESSEQENSPATEENQEIGTTLTRVSVDSNLVTIAGYVNTSKSGECKLKLRSPTETKEYINPTEVNPTNPEVVNCSNFRIKKTDLSASDQWVAQIYFSANGYSGTSQEWEFSL